MPQKYIHWGKYKAINTEYRDRLTNFGACQAEILFFVIESTNEFRCLKQSRENASFLLRVLFFEAQSEHLLIV